MSDQPEDGIPLHLEPDPKLKAYVDPGTSGQMHIEAALPAEIAAMEVVEGEDGAPKLPTFNILGYTGSVMRLAGWKYPVVIDIAGMVPAGPQIPAIREHNHGRVVGITAEDAGITIGPDAVRLAGMITAENEDSRELVINARNGFKWKSSIGATPLEIEFVPKGRSAVVNGREASGPVVVARKSSLYEISFVAFGADPNASASLAASLSLDASEPGEFTMTDQWIEAQGFDPKALNDKQRATLQAAYDAEQKGSGNPGNGNGNGSGNANPGNINANGSGNGIGNGSGNNNGQPHYAPGPTIDEIVAKEKDEQSRVAEINSIIAKAIQDRPMMLDTFERLGKAAIEAKSTTPTDLKIKIFESGMMEPGAPAVRSGSPLSNHKNAAKIVEATLCAAGGLDDLEKRFDSNTLNASYDHYPHGLGLRDVLAMAARENGYSSHTNGDIEGLLRAAFTGSDRSFGSGRMQAGGFSTLSLPGILSNVANKFLNEGFGFVEDGWREIAARRNVRDFKTITSYSLTGGFTYEKVGASGEIKHATVGEMEYSNRAETYGRMFAITRRDLINDDLGALTQIPRKLGRGAALKLNEVFWSTFLDAHATFFTAARGNLVTGDPASLLSTGGLTAALSAFRKQTDPDGDPLGVTPRILLVPPELEVIADELMTSTMINSGGAATDGRIPNRNTWAGKFRVVVSSYLSNANITGNSDTAWFLLADPNDLATIEVAFLNGRETPIVDSAEADFHTLGIQMRGYHDFGCSRQEFRAGVRAAGA